MMQETIVKNAAFSSKGSAWSGNRTLATLLLIMLYPSICMAAKTMETVTVRGEVYYPQRMALAPDAVLYVVVEDVSRADAPAIVLAQTWIKPAGQVPIPFELAVDKARVQPRHTYGIRARITHKGELHWINTEFHRLRLDDNDQLRLRVDPVGSTRDLLQQQMSRPRPGANTAELARVADYVEAHTDSMRQLEQQPQTAGDTTHRLIGYYDNGEPRLIVEQLDQGDYGSSEHRYFVQNDWLYHFRSAGRELAPDNSAVVPVERRIYFDSNEQVLYAAKSVNKKSASFMNGEIASIQQRASDILSDLKH